MERGGALAKPGWRSLPKQQVRPLPISRKLLEDLKGLTEKKTVTLAELGMKPKIAVMDFRAEGVEETLARNITDVVTVELKQFQGVSVISRQEIQAMLNFEGVKQGMGCDDEGCFAEIGNALGVGYLVTGNVGKVEKTFLVNLKLLDIRKALIIGREQENFLGPADGLLPASRFALRRLFGETYQGEGFLKLSVNVDETAVSINGASKGVWPAVTLDDPLQAGKYRLAATREKYFPVAQDVYVEPARQTQVQLMLEKEPPKWWETWLFWTVTGAVVAGAVTTGVVLGTMQGDSPESGSGDIAVR